MHFIDEWPKCRNRFGFRQKLFNISIISNLVFLNTSFNERAVLNYCVKSFNVFQTSGRKLCSVRLFGLVSEVLNLCLCVSGLRAAWSADTFYCHRDR